MDSYIHLKYFVHPDLDSVPLFVEMREGSIIGLTSPLRLFKSNFVISGSYFGPNENNNHKLVFVIK